MNYSDIIESIARGLANDFDTVYHSAEIIQADNEKLPAVVNGDDWIELNPGDQKGELVYVRRNGSDEVFEEFKAGSCMIMYRMRTPLRIVYFRDRTDGHDTILYKILQNILIITGVKLQAIIRDKWRLSKDESSIRFPFGASTAYAAVDIYAYWELLNDQCESACVSGLENPVKKCS